VVSPRRLRIWRFVADRRQETDMTKRNPIRQSILYYYRCPKCAHVSIYVSYNDWLSCGFKRCGIRFIRFGNTMDEWEYKKIWGIA